MKTKLNALSAWLDRHALLLARRWRRRFPCCWRFTTSAAARWAT